LFKRESRIQEVQEKPTMPAHIVRPARTGVALFACAAAFAFAGNASTVVADDPKVSLSILIQEGQPMPDGNGTVGIINDISVNNNGDWIADVNVVGGTTARAIVKNGQVWLANGDPIDPNDTVSSVANLLKALNNNGDVVFRPTLSDNNSGLYFNFNLLLLHNQISSAPQFSEDSPYTGFFRGRATDDGVVYAIVTVNDSELPGSVHRTIVRLTEDPKSGDIIEEAIMWRHGPAPGTEKGVTFDQVNSASESFAIDVHGDVHPRRADVGHERVETLPHRPGPTRVILAQQRQHALHLPDRLMSRALDHLQGVIGAFGVLAQDPLSATCLDRHHADVMAEHIVQLPGDPQALLSGGLLRAALALELQLGGSRRQLSLSFGAAARLLPTDPC
jgi:hypothetical protein